MKKKPNNICIVKDCKVCCIPKILLTCGDIVCGKKNKNNKSYSGGRGE